MTGVSEAREAFEEEFYDELQECAEIAVSDAETRVSSDEITLDANVELSDKALMLGGAVAALGYVDVDSRLELVLDGECPRCNAAIASITYNQITKDGPVSVRCVSGHEESFSSTEAASALFDNRESILNR